MESMNPRNLTPETGPAFRPDRQPRRIAGLRLASAAAAALATIVSVGGVLLSFERASPGPWIQPTPALLAALAQCDALASRGARESCNRALVDRARTGAASSALVAQR